MKMEPHSMMPAGRRVDAFEWRVRFGCGAVLGLVVGLGLCVRLWPLGVLGACALVGVAMVACGLCAASWGDSFWAQLRWLQ